MSDAPPEATGAPEGEGGSGGSDDLPERIGPYRVLDLLGAGGMGRVHRALDEALDREVALKTLLPALAADREFVARFTREARSAASLNHPNITQIYATGQNGAIPWFSMELIRGQSLEALARDHGAIEPYEAASYIRQAAMGLRHAAQKGLIHRDIKPSNLMLTTDGVVKITDFGLAKAAQADTRLTATGEVLGSPGYISPEQAQGHEIDLRSDIYSLGASFYHLVTGRLPFQAPTAVAMILKHMNEPLKSPRAINADIPFPIASIVQKMMAKRPGERFQDYDALLRDLDRALSETRAMPARAPAR
ncbi:MAG TPA: protein kinase, partial [Candidatus Polarisedimenticolia bacterium]|nr:protein kinase [Candidatus Polarisedimenticolia bacterium]